jgi:hypothetical protein
MGTHNPNIDLLHEQSLDIQHLSRAWGAVKGQDRSPRDGKAAQSTTPHDDFQMPVSDLWIVASKLSVRTVTSAALLNCSFLTFTRA